MAARMAMMADDISQVLKDDSKAGRDAPPLALAYRYAVERRDEDDARQQALLQAGIGPSAATFSSSLRSEGSSRPGAARSAGPA